VLRVSNEENRDGFFYVGPLRSDIGSVRRDLQLEPQFLLSVPFQENSHNTKTATVLPGTFSAGSRRVRAGSARIGGSVLACEASSTASTWGFDGEFNLDLSSFTRGTSANAAPSSWGGMSQPVEA